MIWIIGISSVTIVGIVYVAAYILHLQNLLVTQRLATEILRAEKHVLKSVIGLDKCGDGNGERKPNPFRVGRSHCTSCEDGDGEISCPFYGEPNGCNNRFCKEAYNTLYGKENTNER